MEGRLFQFYIEYTKTFWIYCSIYDYIFQRRNPFVGDPVNHFVLISQELIYLGIEFKRASAARNLLWAVGGDHQLYVMMFGVEVPIRVKEVRVRKTSVANGFSWPD